MSLKKKTGILLLLAGMAVIAALVWYGLLAAEKDRVYAGGTFVIMPSSGMEEEAA